MESDTIRIEVEPATAVVEIAGGPHRYVLENNYPNPFNPTTNIGYTIANFGFVTLKVYDVLGREAATLVNEVEKPGSYEVEFNAGNLPSGVYFYELSIRPLKRSGIEFSETKKLTVLK